MSRVIVVGAGVIGLCTAWALRQRDHEVVVLDGRPMRDGASWGNAGWIVPSLSAPVPAPGIPLYAARALLTPSAPVRLRPSITLLPWLVAFTRHCTKTSHSRGTEATLALTRDAVGDFRGLRESGVEIAFQQSGVRFVGTTRSAVEHELEALAILRDYGYDVPEIVDDGDATRAHEPLLSRNVAAGFHLAGDAHLDPRDLLRAIEGWLASHGVAVHRDRPVTGLRRRGDTVTAAEIADGAHECDAVVIATGAWAAALTRRLGYRLPVRAGKGYSFSVASPAPTSPLYLLEAKVAVTPMAGRVRFAGMMEFTGNEAQVDHRRLAAMERRARQYLASWSDRSEPWAGLRPMTPDGLPVIGAIPGLDNAFIATGHAMLGITLGPTTGLAVAGLIDGRRDPRLDAFTPARFAR